jgi:hypothetical protein
MKLAVGSHSFDPLDCTTVIVVPEQALIEAGHIRCLSEDQTGQSKHEFYALGQMAFIQYPQSIFDRGLRPLVLS